MNAKVREFDGVIKTNFLGNGTPKENMQTMKLLVLLWEWTKKNHPQVYLEECKYKIKKIQMSRFMNAELKSDSELEVESKSDTELMAKLKSSSDFDSKWIILLSIFTF